MKRFLCPAALLVFIVACGSSKNNSDLAQATELFIPQVTLSGQTNILGGSYSFQVEYCVIERTPEMTNLKALLFEQLSMFEVETRNLEVPCNSKISPDEYPYKDDLNRLDAGAGLYIARQVNYLMFKELKNNLYLENKLPDVFFSHIPDDGPTYLDSIDLNRKPVNWEHDFYYQIKGFTNSMFNNYKSFELVFKPFWMPLGKTHSIEFVGIHDFDGGKVIVKERDSSM